jgi:spermidine synthase
MLYIAILITGASGIVAQIVLLRELLINYLGNELTLGVILANWLICESLGVFLIGKLVDKIKDNTRAFVIAQIIFSLVVPACVYLARAFKLLCRIQTGEIIGVPLILASSFLILFAPAFCHGALFSCGAKIASLRNNNSARAIGAIYALETIGTIIGGVLLTYILLPCLNSFSIVFIVSLINFVSGLALVRFSGGKILKYAALACAVLFGYVLLRGGTDAIHRFSVQQQFKTGQVLDYQNSVYGNVMVTKKEHQLTFFYDGVPAIITPAPDITFVEELGHLPLLFHQHPRDILIISGGAGGIIYEALKHPVKKIDYVELDPLTIAMLKKFPTALTQKELFDPRVNVINTDGRFYAQTTATTYDVVLLGLSNLANLSTNRLFTLEFFALLKQRLNPHGLLAFYLPGSLAYLSQELKNINSCVLNAAKKNYAYVRVIPGDYNIYLASDSPAITEVTPELITRRMQESTIAANTLVPGYLKERLKPSWVNWFNESMAGATSKINQDTKPYAVFQTLILWNKQFSPAITGALKYLGNLKLYAVILTVVIITFLLFAIFSGSPAFGKVCVAYAILTTGFFSMLMSLILIFIFQVLYGYLYHVIGLLISLFMGGIALGSILIVRHDQKNKNYFKPLVTLELLIVLFTCATAWAIPNFSGYTATTYVILLFLSFVSGALVGFEFPLACKIYLQQHIPTGETTGLLSFFDLIGGCSAGVLGGVLLLPVLGLFNSCIVIITLKLSSFCLVAYYYRYKKIAS